MPIGLIDNDAPEVDSATAALVQKWLGRVEAAKTYFEPKFKRIREDMQVACYGADDAWLAGDNYTVPIVQRHINRAVATLYAKNPRAVAERRKRLMFKVWDGRLESVQQAMQMPFDVVQDPITGAVTQQMNPVLKEIMEVREYNDLTDRVGRTLEAMWSYYASEQSPSFKKQMKQLVRRAKVCGIGYLWLDFQRALEPKPDVMKQLTDVTDRITTLERLAGEAAAGEIDESSAEMAQLRALEADLQAESEVIVREGLVFDFPRFDEILVDPATRHLNGFIGAQWIDRTWDMHPEEVEEVYKVKLGRNFKAYTEKDNQRASAESRDTPDKDGMARVHRIYHKRDQTAFTLIEGYLGFIEPVASPKIKLERFWPVFTLTFNEVEHNEEIYPPSDVRQMKHAQQEYNRARQGLREHRMANRPAYITSVGKLSTEDKEKLANHPANAILELTAIQVGEKAADLLQPMKTVPIDPAVYDVGGAMQDVLLSAGSQEANLGPTGDSTATESSIAENGRTIEASSNVDDLDEFLSEVAQSAGEVMLLNLSPETVTKIAGPGAVWPQVDRQTIAESISLQIKAGSSGRPNAAAELAKMERFMPYAIQIPGINPTPLVRKFADLLDLDVEDLVIEGVPSITAQNALAGKPAAAPSDAPGDQGGQGGDNAAKPGETAPGAQPAYPEPNVIQFDNQGNRIDAAAQGGF